VRVLFGNASIEAEIISPQIHRFSYDFSVKICESVAKKIST